MGNKFGPRVIGREAAEEAQIIEKARGHHFGPRVIGDVFRRRTEIVEEAQAESQKDSRSDPATKMAKKAEAAEKAKQRADTKIEEEKETVEAPITANLDELEEALKANPAFYEPLYAAEQQRAEGPRKGALRLFLAFELDHEDREDRKSEIEELLKG